MLSPPGPQPSISMDPDAFVQGLKDGVKQPVVFFNPTGWRRTSIVSLEIPALDAVAVMDADGDFLVADVWITMKFCLKGVGRVAWEERTSWISLIATLCQLE